MKMKKAHEANRLSWNAATRAHNSHKGDQASFLRGGGTTLFPEELELLGPLEGRRLLHAMCNSGQDTLSLAQLGAEVTGVDISDEAISAARQISQAAGIPANFERSDIYDWFQQSHRPYDLAFASYGAIYWLSDLKAFTSGIARHLRPGGGKLVIVEFHPTMWIFDDDWTLGHPYTSAGEALTEDAGVGDYVRGAGEGLVPWGYEEGVADFQNPHACHNFPWGLGEIVTAVIEAGLTVTTLREYPYANGCSTLGGMTLDKDRRYWPPAHLPNLPIMFGLVAEKG